VTSEGTSFDGVVVDEAESGVDWLLRRGGRGRKLQEPEARWETRVKISEMSRC
jgi:hypothetical protein